MRPFFIFLFLYSNPSREIFFPSFGIYIKQQFLVFTAARATSITVNKYIYIRTVGGEGEKSVAVLNTKYIILRPPTRNLCHARIVPFPSGIIFRAEFLVMYSVLFHALPLATHIVIVEVLYIYICIYILVVTNPISIC